MCCGGRQALVEEFQQAGNPSAVFCGIEQHALQKPKACACMQSHYNDAGALR